MYMPFNKEEFTRTSTASPAWRKVLHLGMERRFPKGASLPDGLASGCLYFIAQGEVRMELLSNHGTGKICWYIDAGSILGEAPLFHKMPGLLHTVCVRPCVMYAFTREVFLGEICRQYPDLMEDMFRSLAVKVRVLLNQVSTLALDELPARICKYFRLHMERNADGIFTRPLLSQSELANLLGVHRVTCTRVLLDLKKRGVIGEFKRDCVRIFDEAELERLAQGIK